RALRERRPPEGPGHRHPHRRAVRRDGPAGGRYRCHHGAGTNSSCGGARRDRQVAVAVLSGRCRMRSHSRRTGVLLLVAGVVLLATPVMAAAAPTDSSSSDQPQIGLYDVTAESTGIGAPMGDPSSQPYPVAAGLVPNALAQLSAGPSGHALATMMWPGPLAGNAGTLAN